jgi:predicted RNase H-like HicB family nuclease
MTDWQFTFFLEKDDDGRYTARCLELKGVYGQGETEEEAFKEVQTALDIALSYYKEEKLNLPYRKIVQVKRDVSD